MAGGRLPSDPVRFSKGRRGDSEGLQRVMVGRRIS